jgi:hypothetical protein
MITVILTARSFIWNQRNISESFIILWPIKFVNIPQFIFNDLILFHYIISELFLGWIKRNLDDIEFINSFSWNCKKKRNFSSLWTIYQRKPFTFYEIFVASFDAMIVYSPVYGKWKFSNTTCRTIFFKNRKMLSPPSYQILNPKSIQMCQSYEIFHLDRHKRPNGRMIFFI